MTRGRITAYLFRYQLRDFAVLRALLPAFVVTFFSWVTWKTDGSRIDWTGPDGARFALEMFRVFGAMFITLAAFLGAARLVADDRSNGYFRFLFSKPVSIERFYVQQWLLHGTGLVVIFGLLAALLQAGTTTIPVGAGMMVMGLTWILVGGVGFLLSVLTNADAMLLVLAYVVSMVLHSLKDARNSPMWAWMREVTRFTMPTHKLDYIKAELYAGNPLPLPHTLHVAGYGLLALIAGVIILRRSSFSR